VLKNASSNVVEFPRHKEHLMMDAGILRSLLDYDPETGIFSWRKDLPHKTGVRRAGMIAGSINGSGYTIIGFRFDGKRVSYKAARLAWLYVHGVWPKSDLDHKNRDRTDDRISNLRECTQSQNNANRTIFPGKPLKFKGVYQYKSWGDGYFAVIHKDKKRIRLGPFDTPEEAHRAYLEQAEKLYGEFSYASIA
jgi:hypothetical protein